MVYTFSAIIDIIGVNPYVIPPEKILSELYKQAGKTRGKIPIKGTINKKSFTQTLVKYQGAWRLYVNGIMIKATGLHVGDRAYFTVAFDTDSREIPIHPEFAKELEKNKKAQNAFSQYPPSRQKEINRYLHNIKTKETLEKNIDHIVRHLSGEKVAYHVLLRNKE